jgi:hypothetical protein
MVMQELLNSLVLTLEVNMPDPFLTISAAKTKSKLLKKFLSEKKSITIQLKDCQEAVAQMHGYSNWQTLKGAVEKLGHQTRSSADLVKATNALRDLAGVTGSILFELKYLLAKKQEGRIDHPFLEEVQQEIGKFESYQAKVDFTCELTKHGLEPIKMVLYRALEFFDEMRNALLALGYEPSQLLFPAASRAMEVLEELGMPLPPANMKGFAALAAQHFSQIKR